MFKRAKVVMLPTNEKANITIIGNKLVYSVIDKVRSNNEGFHLYFTSGNKIKEGDFGIVTLENDKQLIKVLEIDNINNIYLVELISLNNSKISVFKSEIKKIIVTTDSSLKIGGNTGKREDGIAIPLPQPSQSFIEVFVREYNKGNIITDVLVEYILYYSKLIKDALGDFKHHQWVKKCETINSFYDFDNTKEELKVNPKDNTITIKKVKDSWNREEVKNHLYNCLGHFAHKHSITIDGRDLTKWIGKNI